MMAFTFFTVVLMLVVILFHHEARRLSPRGFRCLDKLGNLISQSSGFLFTSTVGMFTLWFILGALISSEAVLPYVVMLGSTVAVVYSLWSSYVASHAFVKSYIDENLEFLLSTALNNFFESSNITYTEESVTGPTALDSNDAKLTAFRDRIKDELRAQRAIQRRGFRLSRLEELERLSVASSTHTEGGHGGTPRVWTRRAREKMCTLLFQKVAPMATNNQFFFNDRLRPMGLEEEQARLPVGARLASVHEVEVYQHKVEDLLGGSDVAMLRDGVKYGPRFGYMLSREPIVGRDFNCAIVALPRYPPAEDVPADLKLQMIFNSFNRTGSDYLSSKEFEAYVKALDKRDLMDMAWQEVCALLEYEYGVIAHPSTGIPYSGLARLYRNPEQLDLDFQKLFPPVPDEEDDELDEYSSLGARDEADGGESSADENMEDQTSLGTESDAGGSLSDTSGEDDFDRDDGMINFDTDEEDIAEPEEEEYIRKVLETSRNARKLQFVFNTLTQHYRGRLVDEILTDTAYVAAKILEANHTLLVPVFGQEAVLGVIVSPSSLRRSSTALSGGSRYLGDWRGTGTTDPMTAVLRTVHMDLEQELTKLFKLQFQQTFDASNVRTAVVDFLETVWPQKIQTRARQLLNAQLDVPRDTLSPANRRELEAFPLKTAYHVMAFTRQYQVTARNELRDVLLLCDRVKSADAALQVGVVTKILLRAGVLAPCDIVNDIVALQGANDRTRRVVIEKPRTQECYSLIASVIKRQTGSQRQRLTPEQIISVVRTLVTEYFWFESFKMLTSLFGLDLLEDEFPASSGVTGDMHFHESESYLLEWIEEATETLLSSRSLSLSGVLSPMLPNGGLSDERLAATLAGGELRGRSEHRRGSMQMMRSSRSRRSSSVEAAVLSPCDDDSVNAVPIEQLQRLQHNLLRMKLVFDQLSNGSGFLPANLADEAMMLLSDTGVHVCTAIACLQHLGIGGTSLVGTPTKSPISGGSDSPPSRRQRLIGTTATTGGTVPPWSLMVLPTNGFRQDRLVRASHVLEMLGATPRTNVLELDVPLLRDQELFDWTIFRADAPLRSGNLAAEFRKQACVFHGFIGKSQIVEFVKDLQRTYTIRGQSASYYRAAAAAALRQASAGDREWRAQIETFSLKDASDLGGGSSYDAATMNSKERHADVANSLDADGDDAQRGYALHAEALNFLSISSLSVGAQGAVRLKSQQNILSRENGPESGPSASRRLWISFSSSYYQCPL